LGFDNLVLAVSCRKFGRKQKGPREESKKWPSQDGHFL
jgi:hypothetical protein